MQTLTERKRTSLAQEIIYEIKKYSLKRPMGHPHYVQALIHLEVELDLSASYAELICLRKIRETQIAIEKEFEQSNMDPNRSELYHLLKICNDTLSRKIQCNDSTPFFKPESTQKQSKSTNEEPQDETTSQSSYGRSF